VFPVGTVVFCCFSLWPFHGGVLTYIYIHSDMKLKMSLSIKLARLHEAANRYAQNV